MENKKVKRLEFDNLQKAQIFARDKALCGFTGKPLWVLDYGMSYLRDSDWVDHIKPATRGGKNILENGICASSEANAKKGNNGADNKYIFKDGLPTIHFYKNFGFFPKYIIDHLKKMENIDYSDWYINRAFKNFMIAADYLISPYDLKGNLVKRQSDYWAKTGLKNLINWRKITKKDGTKSFLERIYTDEKFGPDQKIMLKILDAQNVEEILEIAKEAKIYLENSKKYLNKISNREFNNNLLEKIKNEKYLGNYDKKIFSQALEIFSI